MKQSSQKRFVRHFMASILSSDMTENEIKELIYDVFDNPELIQEIKWGLKAILDISHSAGVHKHKFEQLRLDEPIEIAYNVIKNRRLSKSKVLGNIKIVSGSNTTRKIRDDQTVREIIENFFSVATPQEQELFLEILGHKSSDEDAYLQGIIRGR